MKIPSAFCLHAERLKMTVLFLIRHASNDYLKENRFAGWIPGIHLDAQGQREADALARRLQHISIHAIYSSPLERAIDTANAVAQCQKLDVQIVQELGDTRIGEWEGKLIKDVESTDTWKQLRTQPVGVHIGGGESIDEVQKRMIAAIDHIVAKHPQQIVAVCSHADPIKSVVAHYLKMDLNEFQRIAINPASVTVFTFSEQGPLLFRLNDGDKLPSFKPEKEKPDDKAGARKE
jgi:probable phosphoglycerate mutase